MPDFSEAFHLRKECECTYFFLIIMVFPRIAVVDAGEVEGRADEILGPVFGNEYDLLLAKLTGT